MSQHIERDQLSPNIKMDFLLFPKWLFFHLNFGANIFEIGHCVLEIWQIYWRCHNRLVESWFWEKGYWNLGICTQFWYLGNSEVNFDTKTLFLHQILQVTWRLSTKNSKVWEISKNDFGTIFWDILTLHPDNSKSSLPTTGTFRYVELILPLYWTIAFDGWICVLQFCIAHELWLMSWSFWIR